MSDVGHVTLIAFIFLHRISEDRSAISIVSIICMGFCCTPSQEQEDILKRPVFRESVHVMVSDVRSELRGVGP